MIIYNDSQLRPNLDDAGPIASKTKCMLFNRSLPAPARRITTLDGSDLEYVDNYKYLGVWLDCKLSFQTHIKHLQTKNEI